MDRDQAIRLVQQLLTLLKAKNGSDLFISAGFPPAIKVDGQVTPVMDKPVSPENAALIVRSLMADRQIKEFEATNECQFAISPPGIGRFRISAFVQQGCVGAVMRTITTQIPTFEQLGLPEQLKNIVMSKRGLVIMVGATGSGKSTSLAAMIEHRNIHRTGHILTIEDPIEYLFEHKQSLVNQREIGVDTHNYHLALQNALREAPDLIMIGEIRDKETMQAALLHTLTGHLCLSTIHANNSYHALSRIINLFPHDTRTAVLSDLSIALRAIVSQRLVRNADGGLQPAVEILLNTTLIAELIKNGEFTQIKEAMEQSLYPGSQTFEQSLCKLFLDERISYDEAMIAADSSTNLAWLINQNTPTSRLDADQGERRARPSADFGEMTINPELLERST